MTFKWLTRLAVLPVVVILTILEWGGTYIIHFIGMLCRLIAGTIFLLAVAAWLTGLSSFEETVNTLITGFIFYLIPQVGRVVVLGVALANAALMKLIKS